MKQRKRFLSLAVLIADMFFDMIKIQRQLQYGLEVR